jgi:hypothetical protein
VSLEPRFSVTAVTLRSACRDRIIRIAHGRFIVALLALLTIRIHRLALTLGDKPEILAVQQLRNRLPLASMSGR